MQTDAAEARLREAAAIRQDKILLAIQAETSLIAREVHYHRLCYNNYTRRSTLDKLVKDAQKPDVDSVDSPPPLQPTSPVDRPRAELLSYVRNHLLEAKGTTSLSALTSLFNSDLQPDGMPLSNLAVKRILESEFGKLLSFCRP